MDEQLKNNLTSGKLWLRMGYMLLVAFLLHIASFAVGVLVIIQCAITLVTGSNNLKLKKFSLSLVTFIQQGLSFIVFHSENKPFPFDDWPEVPTVNDEEAERGPEGTDVAEESPIDDSEVSVPPILETPLTDDDKIDSADHQPSENLDESEPPVASNHTMESNDSEPEEPPKESSLTEEAEKER